MFQMLPELVLLSEKERMHTWPKLSQMLTDSSSDQETFLCGGIQGEQEGKPLGLTDMSGVFTGH